MNVTSHRRATQAGFTLTELMATVVIVGVLATLAVVGFRKYIMSSKTSEAVSMLTNIRAAEESYKDETYTYLDVSTDFTSWYPAATPGQFVTQWGATTTQPGQRFATLGVVAGGPVRFTYAVVASPPGGAYPAVPTVKTNAEFGLTGTTASWFYVAVAKADLDGDGSKFTYVLSHSLSNDVYIENDGS